MIREIQRILVDQPLKATPYDGVKPPHPVDALGERVQVNVFHDEDGHVLERWQFSEKDVRWYRLEAWKDRWVSVKVEKRTAVGS